MPPVIPVQVTFQMIRAQPGTKVLAGDPHQHIYSFNGCCDVMRMQPGRRLAAVAEEPAAGRTYPLTASFRLGKDVAFVANAILRKLGERRCGVGVGRAGS